VKTEKTVKEYRKKIIEEFISAGTPTTYRQKNKTIAMWELLNEGKIIPISETLWMCTKSAKDEIF